MALIEINWNPNRKTLRDFGFMALIVLMVAPLLLRFLKGLAVGYCLIIFAVGLIIFLASRISLRVTKAIYLGLTVVTAPIGWTVGFIVMAVFYFLLITPVGLVFRLFGRDLLNRKFDTTTESCWSEHSTPEKPDRYFHQS